MTPPDTTVDVQEIEKFDALAQEWWALDGPFAPLHRLTPTRMEYITSQIAAEFGQDRMDQSPFSGLSVLDIGCGGGLTAEPLARLGASVTGIDAAEQTIAVAQRHAAQSGLSIDYRVSTAEALAETGAQFDTVLALEIVEHVADPAAFLSACATLVRPGGLFIASTLNRTAKSYALAIVGAEYILGWLPKGTHDWSRFLTPDELTSHIDATGLDMQDRMGMAYVPLKDTWRLTPDDLSVNYLVLARKPEA
ncbi:MAG: bifunctional 2-polyprenyl-6-hydroxyphenol methylase/3-demethylubiquinol 3-O-methyltransferase UbiG [Pseudomonadota bacterium]